MFPCNILGLVLALPAKGQANRLPWPKEKNCTSFKRKSHQRCWPTLASSLLPIKKWGGEQRGGTPCRRSPGWPGTASPGSWSHRPGNLAADGDHRWWKNGGRPDNLACLSHLAPSRQPHARHHGFPAARLPVEAVIPHRATSLISFRPQQPHRGERPPATGNIWQIARHCSLGEKITLRCAHRNDKKWRGQYSGS